MTLLIVQELQVEVRYFAYTCAASSLIYNILLNLLLLGHHYVLDFVSVILAIISSRKIKVEVVNDAKYVLAIVFFHFINVTIFYVVAVTLRQYPNIFAITACLSVLEPPFAILLLTFIPKVSCCFTLTVDVISLACIYMHIIDDAMNSTLTDDKPIQGSLWREDIQQYIPSREESNT